MADKEASVDQSEKKPMGRPLKIQSVAELNMKIEQYFESCDPHIAKTKIRKERADGTMYWAEDEYMTDQRPYTMAGLAESLGISRQTLIDYAEREDFLDSVGSAKEKVHRFTEEQLFGRASSGAAFSLKNNWGWKDKQEVDHTTNGGNINPVSTLTVAELRKLAQED